MAYLLDTSILTRLANTIDPLYADTSRAVFELYRHNEILHLTPQVSGPE